MNVLSLFDGMACGLTALKRAGIKVDNYFASEIDKYAIRVAKKNHPEIKHIGAIEIYQFWDLPKIDLIIGGSPCQGFSFAGKQLNFEDPRSKLFFDFVGCIKLFNPDLFLLENVKMKKEVQNEISRLLGVEPVLINSNLLSAQNRDRNYWFNWESKKPDDKGIILKDIIMSGSNIVHQIPRGNNKGGFRFNKSPCVGSSSWVDNVHVFQFPHGHSIGGMRSFEKCPTVLQQFHNNYFVLSDQLSVDWYKHLSYKVLRGLGIIRKFYRHELELLQTAKPGYTSCVSYSQAAKMIGNGMTIDMIAHILDGL